MIDALGLTPLIAKIFTAIAAALLVIGIAWLAIAEWGHLRSAATEKRVESAQHGAALDSAKDAIGVQGAAATREAASEDLTRTNEKEIRDAKGSDAAVDPAARDAGLAGLCRRTAYRTDPGCMRFAPSR